MASSVNISLIQSVLKKHFHFPVSTIDLQPIGGGSINETYKVVINRINYFFCKINSASKFTSLFQKEKNGLQILAAHDIIRTPAIFDCDEAEGQQILLLEWIEQGLKTKKFWQNFGEQLAKLHRVTHNHFGLHEDNYIGALPQHNTPSNQWVDFFIHKRIEPQIKIAADNHLLAAQSIDQFRNLYKFLPSIFPEEQPSLLHGDLWSGNYLCDEKANPVVIDPAVYFGNRHMDMAMTTLFGGFDECFYASYQYHFPYPSSYREIWDVCNLYPLLIHLNLFGKSYLYDILHTIQRY